MPIVELPPAKGGPALPAALPVREVLTRFGSAIRVRLGVHTPDRPNEQGLILVQLCCEDAETRELLNSVNAVSGVCASTLSAGRRVLPAGEVEP